MQNDKVRALPHGDNDNFTDVVVRVPATVMESAWQNLEGPMKDSPDYASMRHHSERPEFVFNEDELKLLCGVLATVADELPMGPYEYIRWIERMDEELSAGQFVSEFVAKNFMQDPRSMAELTDAELAELAESIPEVLRKREIQKAAEAERLERQERCEQAAGGTTQATVEQALSGADVRDAWNALVNSFDGDDLIEITRNVQGFIEDDMDKAA